MSNVNRETASARTSILFWYYNQITENIIFC